MVARAPLQLGLFAPRLRTVEAPPIVASPATARAAYVDPFMASITDRLDAAGDTPLAFDETTWDHDVTGTAIGLDVELYRNFFLVCLKRFRDGRRLAFESSPRTNWTYDRRWLRRLLDENVIVTFNGEAYDLIVLFLELGGASIDALKRASDQIINGGVRRWEAEQAFGVRVPRLNHVDLMEPNPSVRGGLKALTGRLHGRYLVDLPFAPDTTLTPRQMNVVTMYCHNDVDGTQLIYETMREPLQLRVELGKRYALGDVRSRSDSQIGEMIVKKRVERLTGARLGRAAGATGNARSTVGGFAYQPPTFLRFHDERLRSLVAALRESRFYMTPGGKIQEPDLLKGLVVSVGAGRYSVGIGGLHSTEKNRALRSDDERALVDVDVASQYPSIIRNLGLYPPALGPTFLRVYGDIIEERLAAKAAGDQVTSEGLKIAINGVYGKLGSAYSVLYAPELLIAVTLGGQLSMLMLVEMAEARGITVASANTDGVVFNYPRNLTGRLDEVLHEWEAATGFTTERTPYRAIYSSSVNSYFALREDGKVKIKGPLADPWATGDTREQMKKNPQMTTISRAIVELIRYGTDLRDTIEADADPRNFVTVIKASAGSTWCGYPLGKTVRYYWAIDGEPVLTRGRDRVAKTEGAKPLQELTDRLPSDVDRTRYVEEAARLAMDYGIRPA